MRNVRSTLLITAIVSWALAMVVGAVGTARADSVKMIEGIVAPVPARPDPMPNAGEPDAGSTKTLSAPKPPASANLAQRPAEDRPVVPYYRLIVWIWVARYIGI